MLHGVTDRRESELSDHKHYNVLRTVRHKQKQRNNKNLISNIH